MTSLFHGGPVLLALALLYLACFAYFGVRLSLSDARSHRLPNRLVLRWAIASALLLVAIAVASGQLAGLLWALLGMLLLGGAYLLLSLTGRGAMGMGDVKLAAVLGLNLGYFSLSLLLLATVLAFVAASMAVLAGVALRKLHMKSQVPFGPFMVLGAGMALLVAP